MRQGGAVSASPLPGEPLPRGGDILSIHCQEADRLVAVSTEHSPRILSPPMARLSGLSPHTARPLSRGREEAAERPGGGGGRRIPFNQRYRRQGRGMLHPPPRQPPTPAGRFPMDTVSGDLAVSSRSHLAPPPKILPQPRARYPVLSSRTCPPPSSGRVVSRIRRFTAVVIWGIKP